jgi:hypothetical protein
MPPFSQGGRAVGKASNVQAEHHHTSHWQVPASAAYHTITSYRILSEKGRKSLPWVARLVKC